MVIKKSSIRKTKDRTMFPFAINKKVTVSSRGNLMILLSDE